jgi:hypothetical protein
MYSASSPQACGFRDTAALIALGWRGGPCSGADTAYLQHRNRKPGAMGALGNGHTTMNSLVIVAGLSGLGVFCAVALKGLLTSR